jgi:putative FmdB family regulatory protein
MPTYQYACTNARCGNRFDRVQSFTDPAVQQCPDCGMAVRKVFGSVGVVFKGSGFYRTDSRSENGKRSDDGKKAPADASSNGKADASTSPSGGEKTPAAAAS